MQGFFLMHVVKDRLDGSKQLQLLTGVHYITYWIANFIFDFIICLLNFSLILILIRIFIDKSILTITNPLLFVYLIVFSFECLSFAYLSSNFFKKGIYGFIFLILLTYLIPIGPILCYIIFSNFSFSFLVSGILTAFIQFIFSISLLLIIEKKVNFKRLFLNTLPHKYQTNNLDEDVANE